MIYLKLTIIFCLIFYGFVQISNAQIQDSSILVKVTNQLDEFVADAEIKLIKSEQIEKQIKTDGRGAARFSNLIGGEYQITVAAEGFKGYESEPIIIKPGESKTVSIVLEIAPVESKVEIGGDDEADTDNFGTTRILKQETIDKLPENSADMERVLRQIAGLSVTGEEMPITVDGFQGGRLPPKQAIQQIRINQNIFSAQYEGPYGGGIEIFTKSDIQKFKGSVGFTFADSHLNAANPFIGQRLPSQNRGYNLFLSGPLVRKKASFMLYVNRADNDSSAAINAITLNSVFQPVEYKRFFPNPSRSDGIQFFIKADPTKKHKISFNYFFENRRSEGQGIGDFSLPSRAYNTDNQNHTIQLSDTYLINENIVSQTRFQILYGKNKSFGGSNDAAINVLDAFSGGGSQTNSTNKDLRFEFSNDTTWQMGKYGLGFGWRIRGQRINQISKSNFSGTYTFSGRLAPILDANNPLIDADGNVLTTQISSLEVYQRTLLFSQSGYTNQQIRNLGGGASQFTISGGNPEISASQYDVGLYMQNSYKLNKAVALSFGVRYENQTNVSSNFNFSPRFGIIWSPKTDKKKSLLFALPKISAGVGMFYSRFGINNILNVEQASDDRSQYFITDADILDFYPNVPSVDSLRQFALPTVERFIAAETQTPLQTIFNVNISKKLPSDFSVSFSYSRTRSSRQLILRNVNAPLAGTFDPLSSDTAIYPIGKDKGFVYETLSEGKSESDWYNFRFGIPSRKYLETNIFYTYGKVRSNLVSGSGSPFDPYDFSREFGPDQRDGKHSIFFTASSNNLPFGVSITNFFNISSGTRFNIFTGRDTNGDGFYNERPAFASDLSKPNLVKTRYGILDPNPSPTDTIIPRNLGRGPATFNLDTIINKSFGFGTDKDNKKQPRYSLNMNVFIRNILNINNKGNPIGNMASPNFLRQISYNSDASNVVASSAGTFSGFNGRSLNFHISFGF